MIIGQLKWTEVAIKEVLGVTPRLMRPVSLTCLLLLLFNPLLTFTLIASW
jgi:hypothetical protein